MRARPGLAGRPPACGCWSTWPASQQRTPVDHRIARRPRLRRERDPRQRHGHGVHAWFPILDGVDRIGVLEVEGGALPTAAARPSTLLLGRHLRDRDPWPVHRPVHHDPPTAARCRSPAELQWQEAAARTASRRHRLGGRDDGARLRDRRRQLRLRPRLRPARQSLSSTPSATTCGLAPDRHHERDGRPPRPAEGRSTLRDAGLSIDAAIHSQFFGPRLHDRPAGRAQHVDRRAVCG